MPSVRPRLVSHVRPCLCSIRDTLPSYYTWDAAFCETLSSVKPWLLRDPPICHSFLSCVRPCFLYFLSCVRSCHLWDFFFCETLPSVRCVTLPSVRPCLLSYLRPWILRDPWNHVFCEIQPYVKPCPLSHPAFVQYARPSFLSDSALCDFAIYETQPSVKLCHVWDPAFCEIAFSFIRCRLWVPAFCETLASVTCETLRSVRPCLSSICETCLRDCPCQLTWIYQYHKHITSYNI